MYRFERLTEILSRRTLTSCSRDSRALSHTDSRSFSRDPAARSSRIEKILIANRGEIACRILRTAKKLGVRTVAVYSDIDKDSAHVEEADEAFCIGPAVSSQSYLRQDKIISIAKSSKCQAIHPGYGFLSENAEFAELCQREKVIFIGPPASAIRDMGIKNTSKAIMIRAGVPVIEGYHGEDQSNDALLQQARKIGFPLMIKAIRGGGGKGMRIAFKESEFVEALESARTESQKAFGDSAVLLEKYVNEPRHIEVQIFADKYGNTVHLFERDCSVQRRHQKVIEEAPAPGISSELRSELGAAAVRAAKAVGYVGAGTVEFIMDRTDHRFHFMEMNTRLQVEHPVTEAITGLDLVEWQLRIAGGEELPMKQQEIELRGHAFEARIYAENPRNGFLPGAGQLLYLRTPRASKTVRVETGVREKDEVSVHYDPMIAKLVVWGKDRGEALSVLDSKLTEYNIAGLDTNIEFIKDLCRHDAFRKGEVHTGFIEENYETLFPEIQLPSEVAIQAAFASILYEEIRSLEIAQKTNDPLSPFANETGLRLNHVQTRTLRFLVVGKDVEVDVKCLEPDVYSMRVNKLGPWRKVTGNLSKRNRTLEMRFEIDGWIGNAKVYQTPEKLYLFTKAREWQFELPRANYLLELGATTEKDGLAAFSPMPGVVEKVLVGKGDVVKPGDALVVITAMKMEHIVRASVNGTVGAVFCSIGDNVAKDMLLVKLNDTAS